MGGLTRKELLAGAAAAGVVAGCGGSSAKPAALDPRDWAIGQGAVPARRRASATSTRSCSPRTRSRSATRSSATGAGSTPIRPATCTRTRPSSTSGCWTRPARYLEVPPEFAFTDSTTMGLGLVYGGIRIEGRPVATAHDFYSTHESLRLRFGDFRQHPALRRPGAGHR